MPKLISYPKASQAKAIVLAKAVDTLGGSCSQAMAAEKIGMMPGGGFNVVVSSAVKYGFIVNKNADLSITALFREMQHAYSKEEEAEFLRQSLLSVPLYKALFERFKGKHLPIGMLDKLMVREMEVDQSWASKVSKYFVDDAKACGLLTNDNVLTSDPADQVKNGDGRDTHAQTESGDLDDQPSRVQSTATSPGASSPAVALRDETEFVVSIVGPGMNTSITIKDDDDMVIVEATLNKIRRKLGATKE